MLRDMDDKDVFLQGVSFASSIVAQVQADDLGKPTPDTEWNVRVLLNHMLYELAWVTDIVQGKTVAEVGDAYDGDLLGEDIQNAWGIHLARAQQAVLDADPSTTAHLSYGDVPLGEYLQDEGSDQLIHAWDLGKGIGVSVAMPPSLAQRVYDRALLHTQERADSGLFAPPVEVPEDSDIQIKLLALYGRDARA